jgi:hypothetical protein
MATTNLFLLLYLNDMPNDSISVKEEIARINSLKKSTSYLHPSVPANTEKGVSRPPIHPPLQCNSEALPTPPKADSRGDTRDYSYSFGSTYSDSEESSASRPSSANRARKSDIYSTVSEDLALHIITEIDAGRFISNTPCAPWGRGQKHHPNHPETFKVRRHLSIAGPQTREQIQCALPSTPAKLLRAILHELKEQGIVNVKRNNAKVKIDSE